MIIGEPDDVAYVCVCARVYGKVFRNKLFGLMGFCKLSYIVSVLQPKL